MNDSHPPSTNSRVRSGEHAPHLHLIDCDGCDNFLQQFRQTIRTVGRIRDDELDPGFHSRLLEAFKGFC